MKSSAAKFYYVILILLAAVLGSIFGVGSAIRFPLSWGNLNWALLGGIFIGLPIASAVALIMGLVRNSNVTLTVFAGSVTAFIVASLSMYWITAAIASV